MVRAHSLFVRLWCGVFVVCVCVVCGVCGVCVCGVCVGVCVCVCVCVGLYLMCSDNGDRSDSVGDWMWGKCVAMHPQ